MTDLDAATTTRPAPPELVKPCGYCTGNIIWIQLASGRARTFEPVEIFTASAPPELLEQRGFALHRTGIAGRPRVCGLPDGVGGQPAQRRPLG